MVLVAMIRVKSGKLVLFTELRDTMQRIVLCLDPKSTNPSCRIILYDHLAVLCSEEARYYNLLTDALIYYKFVKRESLQFADLVSVLAKDSEQMAYGSCLRFINTIISTPDDIDVRMKLRGQFLMLGLRPLLYRIKRNNPLNQDFFMEMLVFMDDEMEVNVILGVNEFVFFMFNNRIWRLSRNT